MKNTFLNPAFLCSKTLSVTLSFLFLFSYAHTQSKVEIRCKGDCTLESQIPTKCGLQSNDPMQYVQCTCDNCVMEIVFKDGKVSEDPKKDYQEEVASRDMFLADLHEFIETKHQETEFIINSIIIESTNETTYSILYDYTTNNNITGTVLLARVNDDKWIADCTGTCDCRERFIFSEPPAVECTCDDCVLEVVKKSVKKGKE